MFDKITFFLFILIMLSVGIFFIFYGIKGGLIENKILVNAWKQKFVTGKSALVRGYFYIILGLLFIGVLFATVIDSLK